MAFDFIAQQIANQRDANRYRQRVCVQLIDNKNQIIIDGKPYINFSSNDYLGLNNHVEINKAMQEGTERFGICSSSSSLVTGYHYAHKALEDTVCDWLNKPRCLLFSSGFAANLALLQSLGHTVNNEVSFYLDKLSHASMIDGAYQSKAKVKRFAHNDMQQLARMLSASTNTNKLIASEGVFSMDGDQANIADLTSIAKENKAWLYLDDAHSIGVIGDKGQGSNSVSDIDISMATFGKAMATSGAFLACNAPLHEYLINFCRHYMYSTAISPAIAWASKKSIELVQQEQWRRDKINELSNLFKSMLNPDIKVINSQSSIHAIIVGDEHKALLVSNKLRKQGIWLTAIRPPTVAINSSRLRVTICANHNSNEIKLLANSLNKVLS